VHVLFVHQNFPAQFRYLAPRLVAEHGWQCSFVTQQRERSLPGVDKILYQAKHGATAATHFCTRTFENAFGHAHAVYHALKARPDVQPDLVVAHSGFGSSLYLPFLYDAPVINFFELFYRPRGQDLGYRPELPVEEEFLLRSKTRNAMMLLDLENCDRGWTPTAYQRNYFPPEFHAKIETQFDGIDTAIYHRRANPERRLSPKFAVPPGKRVVTYVARGFERMRGFDIFMQVAKRIYEAHPEVLFLVVGSDNVHYGPDLDFTPEPSYRKQVLKEGSYDLSKFVFTGWVEEDALAEILSLSDLHIYLTQPFIASWSLVNAMACGAVVLASDQVSVREYLRPGENGLLADFFDVDGLAQQALQVLRDPAAARPLGEAAMRDVQEKYSVEVALPRLKAFFEQVAARKRSPSTLMKDLVRTGTLKRKAQARPGAKAR
jgi:glycosyltransferase involved in cell wall biosynthesis